MKVIVIVFCGLYWGPPILGNHHMSYNPNSLKGGYIGDYIREDYRLH